MDLFGKKARLELEALEQKHRRVARKAQVSKGINRTYRAKIELLEARILAYQEDVQRLKALSQELASQPVPTRSNTPLFMSESEEDIRFMKDTEQISILEAEDLLRQLQFDNETILVDDGLEDVSLY